MLHKLESDFAGLMDRAWLGQSSIRPIGSLNIYLVKI